jgi:hypothetical protein
MSAQHEMFVAEPRADASPAGESPLIGLKVKLDRPVDRERPCCRNVCIVSAGKGPHAGALVCADCGQHRGWVSNQSYKFLAETVRLFGRPTEAIEIRASARMAAALGTAAVPK